MNKIKLSSEAKKLKLGVYEHYKGNKYQLLGIAIHSETLEELVVYKGHYGREFSWVRPLKDFFETVEVNGVAKPRFRYLGKS